MEKIINKYVFIFTVEGIEILIDKSFCNNCILQPNYSIYIIVVQNIIFEDHRKSVWKLLHGLLSQKNYKQVTVDNIIK